MTALHSPVLVGVSPIEQQRPRAWLFPPPALPPRGTYSGLRTALSTYFEPWPPHLGFGLERSTYSGLLGIKSRSHVKGA